MPGLFLQGDGEQTGHRQNGDAAPQHECGRERGGFNQWRRGTEPDASGLLVDFFLCGEEGVAHERADGHGTDASGHGGDERALFGHVVEVDVAAQTETALAGGVGHARGANVDDCGARFHHVGGDEEGRAEGGDDDVGFGAGLLDVGRGAVEHGDGGVAGIGLLHHQVCHGLADDVAAAEHHTLLTLGGHVVAAEQFDDAGGGGRDEAGETYRHASHVDGVETVDILAIVDSLDDFLFGDVAGQGELHDEAVDVGVGVEAFDGFEELLLGDVVFETNERRFEAAGLAGLHLVGHVGLGAAVVAHEDGSEVGAFFAAGHHLGHFGRNLFLYVVGGLFAVNECHRESGV